MPMDKDGGELPPLEASSAQSETKSDPRHILHIAASNTVKEIEEARSKSWRSKWKKTGKKPDKILFNVLIALNCAPEWRDVLSYNASSLLIVLDRPAPWETGRRRGDLPSYPRVWTSQDDALATEWLQDKGLNANSSLVSDGVQAAARKHSFHPIQDYIRSLTWDGKSRVSEWLQNYLGVEDNEYSTAVGVRWLISAIARIMQPGCKADCMLVLEGLQGAGKSTAMKELAGPDWFTDEVGELGSKDASMGIAGKWIVEFGELEAFKDVSLEKLKAFLSRSVDRFRPPYGRYMVDSPRQCVFVGTTNDLTLMDVTGNRRFWPVTCGKIGKIDIPALKRDRDQLWAEARSLYKAGHAWWLETPELAALNDIATSDRFMPDVLEGRIEGFIRGDDEVSLVELALNIYEKDRESITDQDLKRIGKTLRKLGFERHRIWKRDSTRGSYIFRRIKPNQ